MSQWQTPGLGGLGCPPSACGCSPAPWPYQQLTMSRGDTFVRDIQVTAPPPGAPPGAQPVPVDITGWTLWFTAKYNLADVDAQAVAQLSTLTSGIVLTTPTAGKAEITMPPGATVNFADAPVSIYYDVQAKDLSGRIFTVERGVIVVTPDVTRTTG